MPTVYAFCRLEKGWLYLLLSSSKQRLKILRPDTTVEDQLIAALGELGWYPVICSGESQPRLFMRPASSLEKLEKARRELVETVMAL